MLCFVKIINFSGVHLALNGFITNLSINTKEEGSVDCHKAVLVAMSEYFRLMFDVGSADVDINVLELNTTSEIVKDVLQFIYKGTTDIHDDNIEITLAQSIDMQLHQLTQQCKDFIEKNLSIDNVVYYHECSMQQTDRRANRQTDTRANRQTDTRANRQTDTRTNRQTDRQTCKQTDRHTCKQTDRQTCNKHTDVRTDRQTDKIRTDCIFQ